MFNSCKRFNRSVVHLLHQRIWHRSASKLINTNVGHQLSDASSNQLGRVYLWGAADCGILPQISPKTWIDKTLKTQYSPAPSLLPVQTHQVFLNL